MESNGSDIPMIPLTKPFFDETEREAVEEVLKSGMVSQGKRVEEFEEKVRKYCGAKYAVAVSSCTAGLYLTLNELQRHYGSFSVWTSAFTFPAVHMVMKELQTKRNEVFTGNMDVGIHTYNMIPMMAANIRNADAIIPIHQFGRPCDMKEIRKMAAKREAVVIEDAACALGSECDGEKIGKHGTAVFSFHGRKIITTGEGGMIVTDDERLYDELIEGRQYGRNSRGEFISSGLNFKMSDVSAAIGIAQMGKINEIICLRSYAAKTYKTLLTRMMIDDYQWHNYIDIPNRMKIDGHNWQSYVIKILEKPGIPTRDQILKRMKKNEIECTIGSYDNSLGQCETSHELERTTLALPIWPGMSKNVIKHVVEKLEVALHGGM